MFPPPRIQTTRRRDLVNPLKLFRSSDTGVFVTREFAKANRTTTYAVPREWWWHLGRKWLKRKLGGK